VPIPDKILRCATLTTCRSSSRPSSAWSSTSWRPRRLGSRSRQAC